MLSLNSIQSDIKYFCGTQLIFFPIRSENLTTLFHENEEELVVAPDTGAPATTEPPQVLYCPDYTVLLYFTVLLFCIVLHSTVL